MVAHRWQSKNDNNNNNKNEKKKSKIKNENKKIEKTKKIFRKKNPQNYHGPSVPNLILSYQALYITK